MGVVTGKARKDKDLQQEQGQEQEEEQGQEEEDGESLQEWESGVYMLMEHAKDSSLEDLIDEGKLKTEEVGRWREGRGRGGGGERGEGGVKRSVCVCFLCITVQCASFPVHPSLFNHIPIIRSIYISSFSSPVCIVSCCMYVMKRPSLLFSSLKQSMVLSGFHSIPFSSIQHNNTTLHSLFFRLAPLLFSLPLRFPPSCIKCSRRWSSSVRRTDEGQGQGQGQRAGRLGCTTI